MTLRGDQDENQMIPGRGQVNNSVPSAFTLRKRALLQDWELEVKLGN